MYLKTLFPKTLLILITALGFLSFACTNDDDEIGTNDLNGTWNLEKSEVTASFMGASMDDTDNSPSGTIVFLSNGLGAGEFSTELFGIPYGTFGDFTWVRDDNKITVTETTGIIRIWTIISVEANELKLSWSDTINDGTADFTFTLTK